MAHSTVTIILLFVMINLWVNGCVTQMKKWAAGGRVFNRVDVDKSGIIVSQLR